MSAIPPSTLPGHKRLHDRVINALELCQESQDLEFKQSAPWDDLSFKLVRTAMSLANRRDGGTIIVGVSEREESWDLEGITEEHLATYDEDAANDFLNLYASPAMRLQMVTVEHKGKTYLAISVPEFTRTPIVCKRDHGNRILHHGAIYVRPPGKPRTSRVMEASELEELLELAAEKRAREFLQQARRVGMRTPEDAAQAFDDELGGL